MRAHCTMSCFSLLLLVALPGSARSEPPDPELVSAEATLRDAKTAATGPSLIKFFQARTLAPVDLKRLADLVPLLGDDEFAVREKAYNQLRAAGRAALPALKSALANPDAEISGRAARLARELESGSETALAIAAAYVLAARKPPSAAATLLSYLPMADDEAVEEAVLNALARVGIQNGKVDPVLSAALHDADPVRRMAAAFVHGRGGPLERKALTPLLQDADARVRYRAAAALVKAGDKQGVAALIALLNDGPPSFAWLSENLLLRIAGESPPKTSLGTSDQERKSCRDAWSIWWKENEPRIDLAKIDFKDSQLGLTLICDVDTGNGQRGKLWEVGADGKERWHYSGVAVLTDVQLLPGRRMLLAEGANNQITERDREGKILWSHRTGGYATTALRLPTGNTLIAGYSQIQEVTPKGKVVFTFAAGGNMYRVRRLRNGNLLFPANGQVVEIDKTGKRVRTVNIPGGTGVWAHVELLPNGRYLVAQYSANRVIELDAAGKVHWEVAVTTPSSASRLPNGDILVSSMDARRIVVFNRARKEVWSLKTQGRPFMVKRY